MLSRTITEDMVMKIKMTLIQPRNEHAKRRVTSISSKYKYQYGSYSRIEEMRGSVVVASVETLESLVDGPVAEPGGNEVGRVSTFWLYTHTCNDISCGMDDIFGNL